MNTKNKQKNSKPIKSNDYRLDTKQITFFNLEIFK